MLENIRSLTLFSLAALALLVGPARAAEPSITDTVGTTPRPPSAKRIEDNSFMIEEAYNQETRVMQHIQNFSYLSDKTFLYQFTQEWPMFGQAHQVSFMVPLQRVSGDAPSYLGDMMLNYRYQLVREDPVAVSPRLSLVAPTGDSNKGTGNGAVGFEVNMPVSIVLGRYFVNHWNVGARFTPNARNSGPDRRDLTNFNYGTSFVWLATEGFNVMAEFVGGVVQSIDDGGNVKTSNTFFVNPGIRGAVNFGDLQVVPGISAPIGIGPSRGTYGVFAYLSFEHPY